MAHFLVRFLLISSFHAPSLFMPPHSIIYRDSVSPSPFGGLYTTNLYDSFSASGGLRFTTKWSSFLSQVIFIHRRLHIFLILFGGTCMPLSPSLSTLSLELVSVVSICNPSLPQRFLIPSYPLNPSLHLLGLYLVIYSVPSLPLVVFIPSSHLSFYTSGGALFHLAFPSSLLLLCIIPFPLFTSP